MIGVWIDVGDSRRPLRMRDQNIHDLWRKAWKEDVPVAMMNRTNAMAAGILPPDVILNIEVCALEERIGGERDVVGMVKRKLSVSRYRSQWSPISRYVT